MGAGAGLGLGSPGGGKGRWWAQLGQGWSLLAVSLLALPWVGREPGGSRGGCRPSTPIVISLPGSGVWAQAKKDG